MARTFSLRSLLIAITILAASCGLLVNYPLQLLVGVLHIPYFLPAAIVWLALVRYSSRPLVLSINAILGALLFFAFFTPQTTPSFPFNLTVTPWTDFFRLGTPPAVGALVLGGTDLLLDDIPLHREDH